MACYNLEIFHTHTHTHYQTYEVPSSNTTVQIVFIDTVILAGVTDPILRSLPPNGPSSVSDADKQWSWIEKTLNESTADWLIVCGHYPGKK